MESSCTYATIDKMNPFSYIFGIPLARTAVQASAVLLMLAGAWAHSTTVVEFAQLPAGLAAWQRDELGIYSVCGPTSKWLYALPAYLAGVRVEYPVEYDLEIDGRQEWNLGRLFQSQHLSKYLFIYRWSRLLPIAMTVLGGCLICEWSTRLFGVWPGILSLSVWCWLPPVLAHGSLLTSDMPAAVAALLAARCFWAFLLAQRPATALLAGLTLGLALATKFTLLVLYPCWALLLICRAIQTREKVELGWKRRTLIRHICLGFLMFAASIVALDALYLFRDVGFRLTEWNSGQSSLAAGVRRMEDWSLTAWLLNVPLPVPLEFIRGLDTQLADTERLQEVYLLGRTRIGGWWYWYVAAALLKVPLPALALFALALTRLPHSLRCLDSEAWAILCTLVPAAEAGLAITASTGTGTNAAFRYLLPSLALTCVWVGRAACFESRPVKHVVIGLLIWLGLDVGVGAPDYIGWQNEVGRMLMGDRPALLGDSLDWGQDLVRLGEWVRSHAREGKTLVCAYGLGVGEPYGLESPTALPTSASWQQATYLAVGTGIVFGYEAEHCISIGGARSWLYKAQREVLRSYQPFDRVGRTIRIYRLVDLPPWLEKCE